MALKLVLGCITVNILDWTWDCNSSKVSLIIELFWIWMIIERLLSKGLLELIWWTIEWILRLILLRLLACFEIFFEITTRSLNWSWSLIFRLISVQCWLRVLYLLEYTNLICFWWTIRLILANIKLFDFYLDNYKTR